MHRGTSVSVCLIQFNFALRQNELIWKGISTLRWGDMSLYPSRLLELSYVSKWWSRQDLNLWPLASEASTLSSWATGPFYKTTPAYVETEQNYILIILELYLRYLNYLVKHRPTARPVRPSDQCHNFNSFDCTSSQLGLTTRFIKFSFVALNIEFLK